jgi:hypothetical protein
VIVVVVVVVIVVNEVGHCLRLPRRVLRSYNTLGIALGVDVRRL